MLKVQQRGNKEVKKPKKGLAAPSSQIPVAAVPVSKGGSTEQPKGKKAASSESGNQGRRV